MTRSKSQLNGNERKRYFKDPRDFQILFLSMFLVYGNFYLNWQMYLLNYLAAAIGAFTVQFVAIKVLKLPYSSLKSAAITTLGLSLLLHAANPLILFLGAGLAIASKFLIRINGKHLFNPGNFGIVVTILLTGEAWISPGQWGSNAVLLGFFGAAGILMLLRVSRLETGITFLLTYAILLFARNVWYLGWEPDVVWHKLSNGSLLLFAFFMITDPMTIPNSKKARIIWSVAVAVIAFWVSSYNHIYTAPIWVLFFISPITVLFDKILPGVKFEWFGHSQSVQSEKQVTN